MQTGELKRTAGNQEPHGRNTLITCTIMAADSRSVKIDITREEAEAVRAALEHYNTYFYSQRRELEMEKLFGRLAGDRISPSAGSYVRSLHPRSK